MITETDEHIKEYSELFDKPLTHEILKSFGWIEDENWIIDFWFYNHPNYRNVTVQEHPRDVFQYTRNNFYTTDGVHTYSELYKLLINDNRN